MTWVTAPSPRVLGACIRAQKSVADVPEAQAVGGGQGARLRAVAGGDHTGELTGLAAAPAHVDEEAHDRTDHLLAEGAGLDLEAEQALPQVGPRRVGDPAHHRVVLCPPRHPAERREVMLADEWVAAEAHGCEVEVLFAEPGGSSEEGVGHPT